MRRILVVDDDKDILEVIQFILEDAQYTVETLIDGQFLFEKIASFKPELIILDIMLGAMDGRVLCNTIKTSANTAAIPVILISASHALKDITYTQGKPDDFISKPFEIDSLLTSVQKQLAA